MLHPCERLRTSALKVTTMTCRIFALAAVAVTMFVSVPAWAAKDGEESTHDGKVVSVSGNELTMTNADGKEHSHQLASDAKVTCDGVLCKVANLKAGMKIRVTTKGDDKKVATHVEALDKQTLFANTHDGKFVSLSNNKLTMTDSKGKEHSHLVAKNATMTCDGTTCKADHLKSGMKIRVTTKKDDPSVATHVEAIDKDATFAAIRTGDNPTNTAVNVRDRDHTSKTPFDQGENKTDIQITANIRKRVVATKMSSNAHNVKIITLNGKVTLRGPVQTDDEKQKIDEIATDVAGAKNVDSQLEIAKQ